MTLLPLSSLLPDRAPRGTGPVGDGNLHEILEAVARQEEVVLIGNQGLPRWHRQFVNEDVRLFYRNSGGYCTLTAPDKPALSMAELVPTLPFDSYRLRAEVRHETTTAYTNVGVYVGHKVYRTPRGRVHFLCQFRFNDLFDLLALYNRHRPNAPPPGAQHMFELGPELYSHELPGHREWSFPTRGRGYFGPRGEDEAWRKLEVTVTRQRIVARFDDHPPVEISVEELNEAFRSLAIDVAKAHGNQVAAQISPVFPFDGGVGLFVFNGTAWFRNVTIQAWNRHEGEGR
jgi:hypothetical protein